MGVMRVRSAVLLAVAGMISVATLGWTVFLQRPADPAPDLGDPVRIVLTGDLDAPGATPGGRASIGQPSIEPAGVPRPDPGPSGTQGSPGGAATPTTTSPPTQGARPAPRSQIVQAGDGDDADDADFADFDDDVDDDDN